MGKAASTRARTAEDARGRRGAAARCVLMAATVLALAAGSAAAEPQDVLGRTIADVRVEVGGQPFTEPAVLQLIETRIGEPLSMLAVRESIDHLVGLGRFQDVRVHAVRVDQPGSAVALRWVLVPVQRIARIEIEGRPVFSESSLREAITGEVGARPVATRLDEIVDALRAYLAVRGYRQPAITPRLVAGDRLEDVVLRLALDAGRPTTIRRIEIQGDAGGDPGALVRDLRLERGRVYHELDVAERAAAVEQRLREAGYYEARIEITARFDEAASAADLVVDVDRGPLVHVVFAGDPLPPDERDALVPIREERSVDLDLLEDASRNIEEHLRRQGYRAASAPYVREEIEGELRLTFTISRGPLHRLARVEVDGNQEVPLRDIQPLLVLTPREPFADSRVEAVAAAIAELYRVRGFAQVAVRPDITVQAPGGEGALAERMVAVRLVVVEGPRTVVGEVSISGAEAIEPARIASLLGLTEGRPFYRPRLEADREAIEQLYRNEGFPDARVEPHTEVHEAGRRLDIEWRIVEGPRVLVDRVLVAGNMRTDADLIRREIVLRSGEPLGEAALIESQRRLAALGLFRRVRIAEVPHSGGTQRDVLVEVEEAPATTLAYGGGLEAGRTLRRAGSGAPDERIDIAPRAFIEVSRRNLWGKNRSISLFTRVSLRPRDPGVEPDDPADTGGYGVNEYRIVGTFREPRLLDRPGDLQITGFLEQAIRSSFNFRRRGIRLDYARRFGDGVTLSGRYAFDRTRLFDLKFVPEEDQLLIDRLFPQVRLSTLTASVLRDTRDDVLDPTRGTLLGTDVTFALRSLASEVGFAKSFVQGFFYRRLPGAPSFTIVAGGRLGLAVGFARVLPDGSIVDDVPVSERFFAGGESTVRGFVLDRLGTAETLNREGFPTGGSGLLLLNAELRTPYWKGLGAVAFVDAGNVFRRAGDIRLAEVRPAAGAGLRYRSPLGPLRFDVGVNLDRRLLPTGIRERAVVFHLSLGQAF